MKDQTEVCPLARGVMFLAEGNPYPNHYRSAFACSVLLYPQHHRPSLRSAFPAGSATGLPSSVGVTEEGRLSLSTGDVGCPCHGTHDPVNPSQYRGISIIASGLVNGVYPEFASASQPLHPSPALPRCWEIRFDLAASAATVRLWVRCQRAINKLLPSCFTS
jgi:hypothetical protein